MKTLGFLVNPVAGMGGSVGLKGTDGVLDEAISRGAVPCAAARAVRALRQLLPLREEVLVYSAKQLGAEEAEALGFSVRQIQLPDDIFSQSAAGTQAAARQMNDVDLLLFAGGDGTARDITAVLGESVVSIGIPAGVKIHSAVYAVSPDAAGLLAREYLSVGGEYEEKEVIDIDEDAYRRGLIDTRLYGYLNTPCSRRFLQGKKAPTPASQRQQQWSIAAEMEERMLPEKAYLVGPGSTTRVLFERLGLPKTLLGFDLIRGGKLLGADLCEREILFHAERNQTELIVTPTGGQGFLFGRGNQQCSANVLRAIGKEHITILATREKLFGLNGGVLRIDTGDEQTDTAFSGYYRAVVGYHEEQMCKVSRV